MPPLPLPAGIVPGPNAPAMAGPVSADGHSIGGSVTDAAGFTMPVRWTCA